MYEPIFLSFLFLSARLEPAAMVGDADSGGGALAVPHGSLWSAGGEGVDECLKPPSPSA